KFTPESGRIEIRSYQTANDLVLEIRDTGIGIPSELKEVIFDKFSKARRAGTRGELSTGLGMSIVKGIVEKHGGRIWLESQEGYGTSFYISLPQHSASNRLSAVS
ncbi:MAG: ATP-binding protein, partial [Spirochaetia bacterium]|nr:ATP-binding protein [Spirochaetia bacterium]